MHGYNMCFKRERKVSSRLPIQNIKLAAGCRLPIQNIKLTVGYQLPIQLPVADSVADSVADLKPNIYGPK